MPSEEFAAVLGGDGTAQAVAALLFIGAGTNVYDAFSAVMSSPWTTEKFTQSPEEERQAKEYVRHAMIISWIYAGGGALIARSVWPIAGASIVTVYMLWLYRRAIARSPQHGGASRSIRCPPRGVRRRPGSGARSSPSPTATTRSCTLTRCTCRNGT